MKDGSSTNMEKVKPIKDRGHDHVFVTLADKNYVDQAKQLFSSAYWNGGWDEDYLLIAQEIPEKKLEWFRKKGIIVYKCKPLWKEKIYGGFLSIVLSKFYLFKPYFKKWKKVIFLDGDMIVRASIKDLKKYKGITAPEGGSKLREELTNIDASIKNKYDLNTLDFCAGVFVLETKIVQKNTFDELKEMIVKYQHHAIFAEQSLLNLYFYKKVKRFPSAYNIMINSDEFLLDRKSIKGIIIHFAWKPKPWEKSSPFYTEWKNNLDRAENICLKQAPTPKEFGEEEIRKFEKRMIMRRALATCIMTSKRLIQKIFGLPYHIGRVIKKISPKIYYLLGGRN